MDAKKLKYGKKLTKKELRRVRAIHTQGLRNMKACRKVGLHPFAGFELRKMIRKELEACGLTSFRRMCWGLKEISRYALEDSL